MSVHDEEDTYPDYFEDETLPVLSPRNVQAGQPQRPLEVAGLSDIGCVRDQNQDTFLIADLGRWLNVQETNLNVPESAQRRPGALSTLLLVADGMGGQGGGEVASAVAVDMIAQYALFSMPWIAKQEEQAERELLQNLGDALTQCQERLQQVAVRKKLEHHNMGTTLTLAYLLWPTLYVAHAGDSRCYLLRDGELTQITKDHTVGEALRESGALQPGVPSRYDHVLVNCVGGSGQEVVAEAHRVSLKSGDQLLLCSDGLTGHVSDNAISFELQQPRSAADTCSSLIEAAKAGGGQDNITVVVARF